MAKKTYNAWCIWSPDIGPLLATVAKTRADAIHKFCWHDSDPTTLWREHKRDGYRCVRVMITAVEKGGA